MRDYVYLKDNNFVPAQIRDFADDFYRAILFVGDNNKAKFKKYFRFEKVEGELNNRQKYKLALAVLHDEFKKKYSKQKIRKTIYISKQYYDEEFCLVKIHPSAELFAKLIKRISDLLSVEQKSIFENHSKMVLRYWNRVNTDLLNISPLQCDVIIAATHWECSPSNEKKIEQLAKSIRKVENK